MDDSLIIFLGWVGLQWVDNWWCGVIFAAFHAVGNLLVVILRLKMNFNIGVISVLADLIRSEVIPSNPQDDEELSLFNCFTYYFSISFLTIKDWWLLFR